jgi:hypothetical protein
MARTNSIILTPAERKAQVVQLKNDIREVTAGIKQIVVDQKATAKLRAADDKLIIKELTAFEKQKALLEAQLAALVNDPAFMPVKKNDKAVVTSKGKQVVVVIADSTDKPKRTRRTKAEMEAFRAGAAA